MVSEELLKIRGQFPILNESVHDHTLIYFDNAATTQKPQSVIDTISNYYEHNNANIHRGVHQLSERATHAYEQARRKIANFIHANQPEEIIFTKGTTESINLVAQSYARTFLKKGDEILISTMEHHANIVPWQLVCEQIGATLKVIPLTENGELHMDKLYDLLSINTKLVAITQMSNAIGIINPVEEIIKAAHQVGAKVLIDGAQAIAHQPINVKELDCDFYVFSGHKIYGPTGIGVLYAKRELLDMMPPYQGGGDMIKMVSFTRTIFNEVPLKFEAGTPPIASAIGFGNALDFLQQHDFANLLSYEHELFSYAKQQLAAYPGLQLIGQSENQTAVISFLLNKIHPHDIGTILDHQGIAVRTGHHCAMPIMQHFNIPATVRLSLSFYNTKAEIDRFMTALDYVHEVLN